MVMYSMVSIVENDYKVNQRKINREKQNYFVTETYARCIQNLIARQDLFSKIRMI